MRFGQQTYAIDVFVSSQERFRSEPCSYRLWLDIAIARNNVVYIHPLTFASLQLSAYLDISDQRLENAFLYPQRLLL